MSDCRHDCGCTAHDTVTGLLHRPAVPPRHAWLVLTDLCGLRECPPAQVEQTLALAGLGIPSVLRRLYGSLPSAGYRWGGDEYLWAWDAPLSVSLPSEVRRATTEGMAGGIGFWHVAGLVVAGCSTDSTAGALVERLHNAKRARRA